MRNNIKMDPREVSWEEVDWIHLVQDWGWGQAVGCLHDSGPCCSVKDGKTL